MGANLRSHTRIFFAGIRNLSGWFSVVEIPKGKKQIAWDNDWMMMGIFSSGKRLFLWWFSFYLPTTH
jgi:hypothetical protein